MHHALHHSCLVSESTILYYYNAHVSCHSLRLHSPLKTVFGKIGDTYQAYCNTYKTHARPLNMKAWDNLWIGISM